MHDPEVCIRRLRYRLARQGMLELDAWLGRLFAADLSDPAIRSAVEGLLACEPPELLAMMHDRLQVPEALRPWLDR